MAQNNQINNSSFTRFNLWIVIPAWIMIFPFFQIYSQVPEGELSDTIFVTGGNYIFIGDSITFIPRDTLLIIPANTNFIIDKDIYDRSSNFYDSVQTRAGKKKWTRILHELLFAETGKAQDNRSKAFRGEEVYLKFEGLKIRNINLVQTEIFGTTMMDTTVDFSTGLGQRLNKAHFYTKDKIILNNLMFREGDPVDALTMADNERILRQLRFIDDAKIQIVPVSDQYVDVYIITKDLFALGLSSAYTGIKPKRFDLYDRNLFGVGHEIHGLLLLDYDAPSEIGFKTSYSTANILGTFIRGEVNYLDTYYNKTYGMDLSRRFVTPQTKYAGGINVRIDSKRAIVDTTEIYKQYKRNYQDYWLGRSFLINKRTRSRIILSTRFIHNNVFKKPEVPDDSNYELENYELYLGSIAFAKERFYKSNLIYGFGRTEDIPYGILAEFTGGWQNHEFGDRYYTSLIVSAGNFLNRFGYVYSSAALGGFISNGGYQQGMIQIKSNYFSNLFSIGRSNFRQFVNIDYTWGIRPYQDETINIEDRNGIRGLTSEELYGTQRLTANMETVAFTPFYLYGFRFAMYGFADFGLIGSHEKSIFSNPLYSGLGFGIRVRNENLVFKTFQVRFAFYPVLPQEYTKYLFRISNERLLDPKGFDVHSPDPLRFE